MKQLSVLLLGPPCIRLDGEELTGGGRLARGLLFYLASHAGPVERDELISLLWENAPVPTARQGLSAALWRLRLALATPGLILVDRDRVGLDFKQITVDQHEFQDLVDEAGRTPWQFPKDQPLPEDTREILEKALGLWRSPRFLEGGHLPAAPAFEAWRSQTARGLERMYSQVAGRLSENAAAAGDFSRSIDLARLALVNNPFEESLQAAILTGLIQSGQAMEAVRYFHQVEERYRRELNTSPSPTLINLYGQVRSGAAPEPSPASGEWKIRQSLQAPFVGRKEDIARLENAFLHGGGVFLFGESGLGKTRLLQEFSTRLTPFTRLLITNCRPAETNLPFQPIIDLFRHQVSPEEWLALPPVWASQLALLLPGLKAMRSDLDPTAIPDWPGANPGNTRSILFEAIRQVFLLLASSRPLLFCLGDAQWSDEATLTTVAYLLDRPPFNRQALLVVSARAEEIRPPLQNLLNSIREFPQAQMIYLRRLSLEETRELVQGVIGANPPSLFTGRLAGDTGGNPLFILETLRFLLEEGQPLNELALPAIPLARSLQGLIDIRLNQVQPEVRRVLEFAAVLGPEFNPKVLAEACQQPEDQVRSALEEMEQRGLVEPPSDDPQHPHYRFIHDKIREVLVREIPPLQVGSIYRRVAQAVENRLKAAEAGGAAGLISSHAPLLAQNYEKAGAFQLAFKYWVQAGRRARQLYSAEDASQSFLRAEKLIGIEPDLPEDSIHQLYAEWNELAYEAEDAATLQRINTLLLELGQKRGSPALIGTALDGLGDACMVSNRFEDGLSYTDQAIHWLEQTDNRFEQMDAYNHRGTFLYMLNQVEEAISSFQDALAIGAGSQEVLVVRGRANAHYQIAVAQAMKGRPQVSLAHAQRSLEDYQAVNESHGQATAYSALALARYFLGQYPQARQDCLQGIELAERVGSWRILGYLVAYRALIETALGNIDPALEYAGQAVELGTRYGHGEIASSGYRIFGDIYSWMEQDTQAIEYYQYHLETSGQEFLSLDRIFRLGFSLCRAGRMDRGLEVHQKALAMAEQAGLEMILVMAKLGDILIKAGLGNWDQAESQAVQLVADTTERSIPSVRIYASLILGEAVQRRGELSEAGSIFSSASEAAADLPQPWIELQALRRLALVRQQMGAPDPAIQARIHALLERLETGLTREPFHAAFVDFRERVYAALPAL